MSTQQFDDKEDIKDIIAEVENNRARGIAGLGLSGAVGVGAGTLAWISNPQEASATGYPGATFIDECEELPGQDVPCEENTTTTQKQTTTTEKPTTTTEATTTTEPTHPTSTTTTTEPTHPTSTTTTTEPTHPTSTTTTTSIPEECEELYPENPENPCVPLTTTTTEPEATTTTTTTTTSTTLPAAVVPPTSNPPSTTTTTTPPAEPQLAWTGANSQDLSFIGSLAVAVGVGLVLLKRHFNSTPQLARVTSNASLEPAGGQIRDSIRATIASVGEISREKIGALTSAFKAIVLDPSLKDAKIPESLIADSRKVRPITQSPFVPAPEAPTAPVEPEIAHLDPDFRPVLFDYEKEQPASRAAARARFEESAIRDTDGTLVVEGIRQDEVAPSREAARARFEASATYDNQGKLVVDGIREGDPMATVAKALFASEPGSISYKYLGTPEKAPTKVEVNAPVELSTLNRAQRREAHKVAELKGMSTQDAIKEILRTERRQSVVSGRPNSADLAFSVDIPAPAASPTAQRLELTQTIQSLSIGGR